MNTDLFADGFSTDPYWWRDSPRPADDGQPPPAEVDVLVIGAGYTGLSAALQTARGGRHTLVLDAEDAGWGCSSRNGGQISTSVKPDFADLERLHGRERAFAILRQGHESLAWIAGFVATENIDCDFEICGRFHAAHNPAQYEKLAAGVGQEPAGLETGAWVVPRAEQRSELGTDAYHGGVVYPRHASFHPGRFHDGLLARVREAGASVVSRCPVTALRRERDGFEAHTPRGRVRAREVVVATNGYTGPLTPWLRRRVIPIGSYVIATERLAPGLADRLWPKRRIVSDTRKVVYYYRLAPDRSRVVFGGRVSAGETDPRVSGPRLHADLVALFPELASVRIAHSWMGFVAYTFDTLAHIGRHDGLHYAMGYCGSGAAMAPYLGMRVGQQVLGKPEGASALDAVPFQTRPLYTGTPWFLAASVAWYRWWDRRNR